LSAAITSMSVTIRHGSAALGLRRLKVVLKLSVRFFAARNVQLERRQTRGNCRMALLRAVGKNRELT
jgi:hypothetical protein